MSKKIILAAMTATVALTALGVASGASAQVYDQSCVRANEGNTAAGAVVGGIAGALLGSAVSGRHNKGEGAVLGGVSGAVVGGAIANSNNHPCPEGYVYRAPPPPPPPPPPRSDFWYGAPEGVHERIDFLQNRINRGAQFGYLDHHAVRHLNWELQRVREQDGELRYRDGGGLSPPDRDYLQHRLDEIGRELHWSAEGWDHDRGYDHDHDHDHEHHDGW